MGKIKEAFLKMVKSIFNVLKLAYKIDSKLLIIYFVTAFIAGISPVFVSYFFQIVIDNILTEQYNLTNTLGLTLLFSLLTYFSFMYLSSVFNGLNQSYYDFLLRNKLQTGLNYKFLKKISSLDCEYLENSETQNFINIVSNTYLFEIPDSIRIISYIFSNIIGLISSSIALISFGLWIPLVIFFIALPRFYFKVKYGNFVWSMFGKNAPESKKLWYLGSILSNTFSIIESRVFQSQEMILEKLDSTQKILYEKNKIPLDNYRTVLIISPLIEIILMSIISLSFIPNVLIGITSIGSFTFFISMLNKVTHDFSWFSTRLGEIYAKSLFIIPFFELMKLPKIIKENSEAIKIEKVSPHIEFKNVSFAYPKGKNVLENVSFEIKPKEKVAFVGVNGAGKSTIIKLLCRFYDVTTGEILINGINIKNINLESWYNCIGTLFQHFIQYNFSVKENIMLGNPKLNDEKKMIEAAEKSGSLDFIKKLKNNYDQMLGKWYDKGEELSGGEWQKLAIARAIYQNAPLLIMDEPTSAIDAESEYKIFNNLSKSHKDKSLILVSHRFSTVRNADKILVIEDGKIIEQGTHEKLMKLNKRYASMFKTQAKGYQ
ncbi:MAG: ABC transporter ATP-binding protein [Candidatus Nanoarchaeia archaeon]|nr:ABC transporter ATP-binding protein [Candidatus Nanoarchaeia archaeon]